MHTLHLISVDSPTCGPSLLHALSHLSANVAMLERSGSGSGASREFRRQIASIEQNCDSFVCWDEPALETAHRCLDSCAKIVSVSRDLTVIPPPETAPSESDRHSARAALGIPDDQLVLLPLGSGELIDAFELTRIAGLLAYAGEPIALLLPERSHQIERARHFIALHAGDWQTIICPRFTIEHFHAADAAIIWPPTEHARRDSLARMKSDALLAKRSRLPIVCCGPISDSLGSVPLHKIQSTATAPAVARVVRDALHTQHQAENSSVPDSSDWMRTLNQLVSARAERVTQGS